MVLSGYESVEIVHPLKLGLLYTPVTLGWLFRVLSCRVVWAKLPTQGDSAHDKPKTCYSHTPWFKNIFPTRPAKGWKLPHYSFPWVEALEVAGNYLNTPWEGGKLIITYLKIPSNTMS